MQVSTSDPPSGVALRGSLSKDGPSPRAVARTVLVVVAIGIGLYLVYLLRRPVGWLLVATFLAPTMFGSWFPSRHLVAALPLAVPLAAWGLRHFPRSGSVLAVLSVAASAWLYADVRLGSGGLVAPRPDAPFGPLTRVFPLFGHSVWPYFLAGALGCGLLLLALLESRHWRRPAGATQTRYSG